MRRRDRVKAVGFWGLGIVVAHIIGPALGGWLAANDSWRLVFYINMPIDVLSVVIVRTSGNGGDRLLGKWSARPRG